MSAEPKSPQTPSVDVAPEEQSAYVALFENLVEWMQQPMAALSVVWLALVVCGLIWKLSPLLYALGISIWIVFVVEFLMELILAPDKGKYLKRHWLTVIALVVPALRIFSLLQVLRFLPALQVTGGLSLMSVVTSMNRTVRALRRSLAQRGFMYIGIFTLLVIFVGAAGVFAFERTGPNSEGFDSYAKSLWWTCMLLTTVGSEYWPKTAEGRSLALIICVYGITVYGYVTATLASFLVGRDANNPDAEVAGTDDIRALRSEIASLREDLHAALSHLAGKEQPAIEPPEAG